MRNLKENEWENGTANSMVFLTEMLLKRIQ